MPRFMALLLALWLTVMCALGVEARMARKMNKHQNDFLYIVATHAVRTAKVSKIPPSVTIAQAILESDWGRSLLARKANNLFGIKSHGGWTGKVYTTTTEEVIGGQRIRDPSQLDGQVEHAQQREALDVADEHESAIVDERDRVLQDAAQVIGIGKMLGDGVEDHRVEALVRW